MIPNVRSKLKYDKQNKIEKTMNKGIYFKGTKYLLSFKTLSVIYSSTMQWHHNMDTTSDKETAFDILWHILVCFSIFTAQIKSIFNTEAIIVVFVFATFLLCVFV